MFDGRNGINFSQEKPEAAPKLLIRVRYTVDGKKGRRPLEVDGTPSTVSLFHFYQAESAELTFDGLSPTETYGANIKKVDLFFKQWSLNLTEDW